MIRKLLLCFALLSLSVGAFAAERFAYDEKRLDQALNAGSPVLVHITAPWCGECRAQKPIVAALAQTPEYANLTIVDVDFDTQKDALRKLKVAKQSTLVVFKGGKEIDRAVGITKRDAIDALLKKAL